MGWVDLQVGLGWVEIFCRLVGCGSQLAGFKKQRFFICYLFLVSDRAMPVCISLTLFDALACPCFLHVHSATLVSNY